MIFTLLTATVTTSAPDASIAFFVSSKSLYFPVPTQRRDLNSIPLIINLSFHIHFFSTFLITKTRRVCWSFDIFFLLLGGGGVGGLQPFLFGKPWKVLGGGRGGGVERTLKLGERGGEWGLFFSFFWFLLPQNSQSQSCPRLSACNCHNQTSLLLKGLPQQQPLSGLMQKLPRSS